jgi:hypothetical protein
MPWPKLIPQPQNIKFLRIRKANRAGRVVSKRGVNNARYSFHKPKVMEAFYRKVS